MDNKECQSWAEYVASKRTGFDVEIVKCQLVIKEVIGVEKK